MSPDKKETNNSGKQPKATPERGIEDSSTVGQSKKNRKYSKGIKNIQKIERRYAKASRRISKAIKKGVDTYLKRRDKSSQKKRDGAIVDSFINVSKGISDGLVDASPAFYDISKGINLLGSTKRQRRRIRRQVRSILPTGRLPFLR